MRREERKTAIARALKERATTWGGLTEWDKLAEAALEVVEGELGELERIRKLERQHMDTIEQLQTNVKNVEARCDFKNEQMEALAEAIAEQEKQIAQMMTALSDQAATIRRLTEERLGPEKPPYEQAKGLGIGIAPQGTGDPDKGFIK